MKFVLQLFTQTNIITVKSSIYEPWIIYTHYNKNHMIYKMDQYSVKIVQIRSFFWSVYSCIRTRSEHQRQSKNVPFRLISDWKNMVHLVLLESFILIIEYFSDARSVGVMVNNETATRILDSTKAENVKLVFRIFKLDC